MCGRYVMPDDDAIGEYWAISCRLWLSTVHPRFNVAPTAQVPILVRNSAAALEPKLARWGLVPPWWTQDKPPALTFNARAEDAAQKPTWRDSLKSTRCLMPARGWYEWNKNEPALDAAGRESHQPYFLFCPEHPVIAFAGLWSSWERPGAAPVLSCALLSKMAAPRISSIHPRMPAVLKPEHFSRWLDPATPPEAVQTLIADARQDLEAYPVGMRVNDARNDGPELMDKTRPPPAGLFPLDGM